MSILDNATKQEIEKSFVDLNSAVHIIIFSQNEQEFPLPVQRYQVFAVPKIVINEHTQVEGALSEATFVDKTAASVTL